MSVKKLLLNYSQLEYGPSIKVVGSFKFSVTKNKREIALFRDENSAKFYSWCLTCRDLLQGESNYQFINLLNHFLSELKKQTRE